MSNLLDRASVVLTPTAYNNGEALCVKPDDASGDFQFSRATEGTRVNSLGLVEVVANNLPRINYEGFSFDGSGNIISDSGCGSWLFEPQRTNLFIQNDYSTWNGFGSYSSNTTISPDGTTINFINFEDLRIFPTFTISNATEYASSIYIKANMVADVKLRSASGQDTTISLSIEWQRFDLVATSVSTTSNALLIDGRFSSGVGAAGLEIALFGGQVEQGAYATSYIPTDGTQKTRNQDICSNGGSVSTINSTEGVLYAEIAKNNGDTGSTVVSLNDGSTSDTVAFYYFSTNQVYFDILSSSPTVSQGFAISNASDFNKIALKYKSNDIALWINGVEVFTSTNTITLSGLNSLDFAYGSGSFPFYGKTKCLAVWKEALTDTELQELTTI